jgi:hypothetical protein
MTSTPEYTAPISTTAMAEPASGRSGSSMPAMPEYHGTRAPAKRSVRRRWRSRDKKRAAQAAAANEEAIELPKTFDDSLSDSDWGSNPPPPPHASESPSQKRPEQVHVPGYAQRRVSRSRSPEQKVDLWLQLTPSPPNSTSRIPEQKVCKWLQLTPSPPIGTKPTAPSRPTKPVLTAFSTSAEIVNALMPDRPAVGRLPRRTVSMDFSHERESRLARSLLISRPD